MRFSIVFTLGLLLCPSLFRAQVATQDSLALVALYNATSGENWTHHTNWLEGPVPFWYGITVSVGRVSVIQLWGNGLSGMIPPELGNLTAVSDLSLGNNNLTGEIPEEIGQLASLYSFNLRKCHLQGEIPATLGNCTQLASFNFGENELTGSLPSTLSNCPNLYEIQIHQNQLSGPFPEVVLHLPALRILSLDHNQFSGSLPEMIHSLAEFRVLWITDNQFSGPLPDLSSLTHLQQLGLSNNQFSGELDSKLGYYPELTYFYADHNQFTGLLSPEHYDPSVVVQLNFHENKFDQLGSFIPWGPFPNWLYISIFGNQFDFDDLLPAIGPVIERFSYSPQYPAGQDTAFTVTIGDDFLFSSDMVTPDVIYQWYYNGNPIPGATEDSYLIHSFSVSDVGDYYFVAWHLDFPGLAISSPVYTLQTTPTATTGFEDQECFVFPNPVTDELYIQVSPQIHILALTLVDLHGQIVKRLHPHENTRSVNLRDIPAGLYMLHMLTEKGKRTQKMIKL